MTSATSDPFIPILGNNRQIEFGNSKIHVLPIKRTEQEIIHEEIIYSLGNRPFKSKISTSIPDHYYLY